MKKIATSSASRSSPTKIALLFGYCYDGDEETTLDSSYYDLFTAYSYLSKRNIQCLIFSDLQSSLIAKDVSEKKKLGIPFLSFHHNGEGRNYSKYSLEELSSEEIQLKLSSIDSLFLYYTGHMTEKGEFCFGSKQVEVKTFLSDLGQRLRDHCQVFCVVDGCHSGINLFPYYYSEDKIRLRFDVHESAFAMKQDCVYFYSANEGQKAASSKHRSYFTKYVFQQLEEGVVSFGLLLNETQKRVAFRKGKNSQTAGILTSQRLSPNLWPWVFGYSFRLENGPLLIL